MEKDNLIDKLKEWQWLLKSMSAPNFLTARRQSLQCRCFSLFCFFRCLHLCVHVCVPGCCCGGTVARTNHYLVVVGLERSAAWNVRLCSTEARCCRALLKCPIKESQVRFEWVCVRDWPCVLLVFPPLCVHRSYPKCKYIHGIICVNHSSE